MTARGFLKLAAVSLLGAVPFGIGSAAPASAQTYGDRNFPFCLQSYAPIQFIDCRYASHEQCNLTASGRGAMCIPNPYFNPGEPLARRKRYQRAW